ncbi:ABC transporter ATP-binding protein [Pedobacter duraquae]|uniref:ABC-2 type transport system ATP-binding protein n=1 Tax=Pedobacter duraquae TaxID=425511 RepID=A0A4R6IFA7_9SPHI|nr:ATP-binding cassette domain-containing protein [Pedobacter duraquae]TDO19595.1 ABC-2 type transport system ATP-binding protein [Pedobacter duraquae]
MALSLESICKKYGSHTVISFQKFQLTDGVYWLKGANGTGKTTLFRIIAGQTPFDGQVSFRNVNLKKQPVSYRSTISYAEAEPQYPGYITGNDLVRYHQQVRRAKLDDVEKLIERFGMSPFMNQAIGGYSSGMLKKLSLICAFIGEIELFLLDEPLITIDKESATELFSLIKEYRVKGCMFLISSHQDIDPDMLSLDGVFMIQNGDIHKC